MNTLVPRSRWRNKERASPTDASSGILLSMDMVSTNDYTVAYTVPVQVGASQQNLSLQVDTGSSDLWIASKSCSSPPCSATSGRLYDPGASRSTGATFSMQYLSGTVDGPIVWDQVQVGDYVIPNQALVAATSVDNEPLSYNFDGIFGLALPSNSLIQQIIPPTTGDAPDGAPVASNLFSLTPSTNAPSQPFFSLTLARPGSNQIPSLLGIGRHPSELVPDPSKIHYSPLVSENYNTLFWKTTVRAITVYVNATAHPVTLQSLSGAAEPTALLDSGVPLIIATPALANGIYGALGIDPASDGNYYVPCSTPLNMTITLDGQNELPLHPLDLTSAPSGQSNSQYCTGLIQTDPSKLTATSYIGDMILGVPFMRNVYTVMAYQQPDSAGNFNTSVRLGVNPALGLLGLTNANQAMQEFDQVRVLNQPLGDGSSQQSSSTQEVGSRLSIGIKILIGLGGFFGLCLALFALRYLFARRRWREPSPVGPAESGSGQKTEYEACQNGLRSGADQGMSLYSSSSRKATSQYTAYSGRTWVEEDYGCEFGLRKSKSDSSTALDICDPWDPYAGTWRDTIIGTEAGETDSLRSSTYYPLPDNTEFGPNSPHGSLEFTSALLPMHDGNDSQTDDLAEFGTRSLGMAGVGTAARGSVIDIQLQHPRPSIDSAKSSALLRPPTSPLRSSFGFAFPNESPTTSSFDADRTL